MATPDEVYKNWRASLKEPDDSIFYYHPNLERILLGLSIFVLSSRPLLNKLGKAESLGVLHYLVPRLVTAWIDGDNDSFEPAFNLAMTVSECYMIGCREMSDKFPAEQKAIKRLSMFFGNAVASAGDMHPDKAEELLDNLSTDGEHIYSDKIQDFGNNLLHLTTRYGMDIPPTKLSQLIGW